MWVVCLLQCQSLLQGKSGLRGVANTALKGAQVEKGLGGQQWCSSIAICALFDQFLEQLQSFGGVAGNPLQDCCVGKVFRGAFGVELGGGRGYSFGQGRHDSDRQIDQFEGFSGVGGRCLVFL